MRLSEVAPRIDATVVRDAEFSNLGFLFDDLPEKLSFVEAPTFVAAALKASGTRCVVCTPELADAFAGVAGVAISAEPKLAFFRLQQHLVEETNFYGESFATTIHPSARIHPRAWIAPNNVRVGPDTVIEANVSIDERSLIGSGVRIRAGAVIGSEGFQSLRQAGGILQMAHGGGVALADHVEIFANAVIAKAVFRQMTSVGEHSRIGNGAFVSHNVQVGARCFVGHNASINGNTDVGDDSWIGPNATVSNLLSLGAGSRVSLGAVVIQSVPANTHVTGLPAIEHRRMLRHAVSIR
jgi:UDP-3-O-[3-hydroxymyristoyl] glucosamine N-acyltransferase